MQIISQWLNAAKVRFVALCEQPHRLYLSVALVGALSFALITPPFQGPDEQAHYLRVQYIAHGYFIPVNAKDTGASLPVSIEKVLKSTFFIDDIRGKSAEKYELNRTKEAMNQPLNPAQRYQPPMVSYNFLTYLPAVPSVFLTNIVNLSPVISLYIARISLAIAAIFISYVAIKLLPTRKYLFVSIALLPMMLFQQAVVGTDGVSYALLMLFMAYLLRLYTQTEVITRTQWLRFVAICGAVVWSKPLLYLFLPLSVLLFKKQHAWRWLAVAATVGILLFGANMLMVRNAGQYDYESGQGGVGAPENVQAVQQLANLKQHPKRAARVFWNSYMTSFGDDEVRGVIGTFGAADTMYPLWMSYVYVFAFGGVALLSLDQKRRNLSIPHSWRWLAIGLALLHFVAVNIAIYLTYTPYNFDIIYGVQGRYFLPTLIIVLCAVCLGRGIDLKPADQRKALVYTSSLIGIMVLCAVGITFQRYFMYTP